MPLVRIDLDRGRTDIAQDVGINARLGRAGVAGKDVFIGYVESGPEDWSFGFGATLYSTGEIEVPASGSPVQ